MNAGEDNVGALPKAADEADAADDALLQRVAGGDTAAFQTLYSKYYDSVLRFIYRVTGKLDLAQEGVNDVMLVVWQSAGTFARRSKVSTWIMGIAYRKGLKLAEKSRRWHARFALVDFDSWNEPSAPGPELTTDAELHDLLEHGLKRLPPKQRAVLELTYRCGYTYEEIAAIVDCPVNTVKTRMFHARMKMRRLLPMLQNDAMSDDENE